MSNKKKKGEVVVITGASAGVGRAAAREFARHGASVGLIARGRDGLEAARREVEKLGGRALVLSFAGFVLAGVTGWLGGELVDRLGVGVDDGAHLDAPNSLSDRPAGESVSGVGRA